MGAFIKSLDLTLFLKQLDLIFIYTYQKSIITLRYKKHLGL
jgi:hypothetical protein